MTQAQQQPDASETLSAHEGGGSGPLGALVICSFCAKTKKEVRKMVARKDPLVAICDECALICVEILITDREPATPAAPSPCNPCPSELPPRGQRGCKETGQFFASN